MFTVKKPSVVVYKSRYVNSVFTGFIFGASGVIYKGLEFNSCSAWIEYVNKKSLPLNQT